MWLCVKVLGPERGSIGACVLPLTKESIPFAVRFALRKGWSHASAYHPPLYATASITSSVRSLT